MADRLGQDWASNDNSVWLAKFKSSPGHFKWQSIKSAMNCLGLFLHSLINFSGIKSCPLLFAITINILIIHRFQTRNRSRNIGKFCRHSPIHSWYLSKPPQAAVVYFFQSGAFFWTENAKFWTILDYYAILLRIYALFGVLFTGINGAAKLTKIRYEVISF